VPRKSTISLPSERVQQLREVAKARAMTITELIGDYLRLEAAKGIIPDQIPGYHISPLASGVRFRVGDATVDMTSAEAMGTARLLERHALQDFEQIEGYNVPRAIHIERRGRGLTIRLNRSSKRSVSIDVARDLVRLLRQSAKKKAGR
jgi:hypothetical protein